MFEIHAQNSSPSLRLKPFKTFLVQIVILEARNSPQLIPVEISAFSQIFEMHFERLQIKLLVKSQHFINLTTFLKFASSAITADRSKNLTPPGTMN